MLKKRLSYVRDFVLIILGSTVHIIGVPRFAIARRRQPIHFCLHVVAGAGHDLHLQPPFFTQHVHSRIEV